MDERTNERTPDNLQPARAAAPDIGGVAGVLSAREAAVALGVSERTVRRALVRGELVATKHAGAYQITPAALDDYRRGQTGQRDTSAAAAAARPPLAPGAAAAAAAPGTPPVVNLEPLAAVLSQQHTTIERQGEEIRRLAEAATAWQMRALQAEDRLKQLTAGPVGGEALASEAHVASRAAPGAADGAERDPDTRAPSAGAQRPWWRRLLGLP